jgi:DNA adenine methylase
VLDRPAIRYLGGKWKIADWVIRHLPPHGCYVEPFAGGASVLLRKQPSRVEVLNDVSGRVVNFFKVLRDQPEDLIRKLELTPMALDEYRTCRRQEGDPVERARRFFAESWQGLAGANGDGRCQGWRRTYDRDVARTIKGAVANLHQVAERLRGVAIDHLDWREVLARYDSPETLFYCDPPYLPATRKRVRPSDGYGANDLTPMEHVELLAALQGVQGAVVLSGYPSDMYDNTLAGWHRTQAEVPAMQRGRAVEVLWSNRPWPRQQQLALEQ